MATPRVLALRAPGTNCDEETVWAFRQCGAEAESRHVNALLDEPSALRNFQVFVCPGGFSYGDDLGAGRALAQKLRRLSDELHAHRDRGGLILGICNGFQALLQTGLLLEPDAAGLPRATLAGNTHGRYEDRWVHVELTPGKCAFVKEAARIELPVAHGEGNFRGRDASVVKELAAAGRIVAKYVDADGEPGPFPVNPNGSEGDVAGVCDATGQIFALMPHPERHFLPTHHPRWTRRQVQPEHGDGRLFFANAVRHFA